MNPRLQQIRERLEAIRSRLAAIEALPEPERGKDTDSEERKAELAKAADAELAERAKESDALLGEWDTLTAEAKPLEERAAKLARVHQTQITPESGQDTGRDAPAVIVKDSPFGVLEDRSLHGASLRRALVDANLRALEGKDLRGGDNERHVEQLLKRHASDTRWTAGLLARSKPAYAEGFAKLMTGNASVMTDEERAAMAVGTATAGGYLVPTHLDPTLILTNAGSSNVVRGISRVVTLTEGSVWHGVTTAGVTASWDGELTEVSDDTPAVAAATVTAYKAQAFVQASFEAFEDIAGLSSDVLELFGDARDRLEGAAHATGSGSSQPKGIFTAVNASASLQVTSTTAATIGLVDVHNLYRTVPVRWRGRSTWLANPLYTLAIKALGTAVSASYSTDITQSMAGSLLGRPLVETDDGPTTQTTTVLDQEIVFGDFSNFLIVDKPGGFSVEFVPQLFNVANNLPDGRRGWFAYWRNGADAVNLAAFRILCDKTSA
jgi:HK97 family phage major capsid protein